MRRTAFAIALAATLFAAAPGQAFEVQSGGVGLSPQAVSLLANRMAGLGGPAGQKAEGQNQRALPPWMAGEKGEAAAANGQNAMMGFMLSGKPEAGDRSSAGKGFRTVR